ncbi:hypothetical protein PGT21_027446 [Puccinia graminis f. sp. tritici]|uniref:RxLR effector protein n=1 Tax=Puccinia graminis f. sp. tritici TaxID=56615 RepID=A0A5B0QXA1_PUCGR|nr:hypothetical protein PGT21_027446 [Puccinia graminis f. sp. tritici]
MITAKKSLLCIALHALGASRLVLSAPMQSARAADDVAHLGRQSAGLHGEEIEQVGVGYNAAGQSSSDVQRGIGHEMSEDRASRKVSLSESEENHEKFVEKPMNLRSDKSGEMDQEIREEFSQIPDKRAARILSSMADFSDAYTKEGPTYLMSNLKNLLGMRSRYEAWLGEAEKNGHIYEDGFLQEVKLRWLEFIDGFITKPLFKSPRAS